MKHREFCTYVPVTMDGATHVSVEVGYRKGGTNLFSGRAEPRGYEVCLNPVSIAPDGVVSFRIGDSRGRRIFLIAGPRFNAKMLETLAGKILPLAEELATAIAEGDVDRAAATARRPLVEAA